MPIAPRLILSSTFAVYIVSFSYLFFSHAKACKEAGLSKNDIDYFITHQPNRFLLDKLTEQLDVPKEKLFSNIVENFGNSSCATIPVNIAYNLGQKIQKDSYKVCLAAFGAGLSLASAICNLGKLDFCEFIEHPGNGLDRFYR